MTINCDKCGFEDKSNEMVLPACLCIDKALDNLYKTSTLIVKESNVIELVDSIHYVSVNNCNKGLQESDLIAESTNKYVIILEANKEKYTIIFKDDSLVDSDIESEFKIARKNISIPTINSPPVNIGGLSVKIGNIDKTSETEELKYKFLNLAIEVAKCKDCIKPEVSSMIEVFDPKNVIRFCPLHDKLAKDIARSLFKFDT